MLEDINPEELQQQTTDWFTANILTPDAAVQGGILFLAFALALIIERAAKPLMIEWINKLKIAFRLTEILRSLTKLIFPFATLIILFIGTQIVALPPFSFSVVFAFAVIKLLTAWIIIRLVVQFIGNRFVRNVMAVSIWIIAALSIFGVLDTTTAALDSFGVTFGDFRFSALTMVKGLLALFIMLYGALFLSTILDRRLDRISSLTPSSRVLISKITRVSLVVTALLIGITTAGIDLSLLAVFSGAVGLGLGFGLQRGISNLFSGMMLLMDQSIKPGDIIEMPSADGTTSTFGWVQFMGSRYTEIITRDNKSYLVPNEQLISQQVVNWSHGDTLVRVETKFGVHYNSDPHEIKKLAVEAATRPERTVESPAPVCHIIEFGDSSINFTLRFWIRDAEKGITNVKGDVMLALWDTFKEHGIKIPYPHREVFIHDDPKTKKAS